MAKIAFFCIPAHGHTNPTLPVVRTLVDMGHEVHYFSFPAFRAQIESAGARFYSCELDDAAAPDAGGDGAAVARDIAVSTKLIVDMTLAMEDRLLAALRALNPDVIVADSVAFWGKLYAKKLDVPFVCSTTTFAFNRYSSRVMKSTLSDLFGLLFKLPKAQREIRRLQAAGYPVKNALDIVQSDNETNSVVYTSPEFQPCAETFSDKYTFVGPCIRAATQAPPKSDRPLVYVSMGTVIQGEENFYRACVEAFADGQYEAILSVGEGTDIAELGALPNHIRALPRVDQIAVLKGADAFITHCGMNSASEALYFGVPLVMRPLTPEEGGVANRTRELGAGVLLEKTDAASIRQAVDEVISNDRYRAAAQTISESFHRCGGAKAAAEAIVAAAKG